MKAVEVADISLWGSKIASIAWDEVNSVGVFEYSPDFIRSGIEISPITMPLSSKIYRFPHLNKETFKGLPGLLSESLPDKFGNLLINAWLARQGRSPKSFSPIERLCYIGSRGMGALEFSPAITRHDTGNTPLEVSELVDLANIALKEKSSLKHNLQTDKTDALKNIISVGTSAGGARAKAVIAWNSTTGEVRSGQTNTSDDFEDWLIKFDGVSGNSDKELSDPIGYGRIEYAYYLMAKEAGIHMNPSRLLEENGRSHFMTKRFDRINGKKIHLQSLCSLAHYDFNMAGGYSYEQAFQVMMKLRLGQNEIEQQFRRMVFNVIARNQDDHTKNIGFLMDKSGEWSLSPAYDVTYSYNPYGDWTSQHQMSINGKRDHFIRNDFYEAGIHANLKKKKVDHILDDVLNVVKQWPDTAKQAKVGDSWIKSVLTTHRLFI